MKICICSSMSFYDRFSLLKTQLESLGHSVFIPELRMRQGGSNLSVREYIEVNGGVKFFSAGHEIWKHKADAIKEHFRKINQSDCVLVTNYEKRGVPGYIGGNTFLEMGYAFSMDKKIYLLNDIPKIDFEEEILGMQPIVLNGDMSKFV